MSVNPDKETMDDKINRIERKLDIFWDVFILVVFSIGGFFVKTAIENEIATNIFVFIWVMVFVWLNSEFKYKKK